MHGSFVISVIHGRSGSRQQFHSKGSLVDIFSANRKKGNSNDETTLHYGLKLYDINACNSWIFYPLGFWAICCSVCSFAGTAHSFACSELLALLARFTALIRSLARSLAHSGAHGKEVFVYELNASISYHLNPLYCGLKSRINAVVNHRASRCWRGNLSKEF